MCRKILSNYNSTAFFASVFRQDFSTVNFDIIWQISTAIDKFFVDCCRTLSKIIVEKYCRSSTTFFDKIFRQQLTAFDIFKQHSTKNFVECCRKLSANVVENCCRILRQHCSTNFAKEAWSIFVEDCRIVLKLCFYRIRQRSLKRNTSRGRYFLFLF